MEDEFPPNSHIMKEDRSRRESQAPPEKVVKRVTKNKATLRKKPLHKKFFEAFRPEDSVGFVEHTLLEVLVPGIKDALADAVHGTIDNALGTSAVRSSRRGPNSRSRTSYNRMSEARPRGRGGRERDDDRRSSRGRRAADDVKEIILDTRVEADIVIDSMFELLSKYEVVTMRDLLSLVGEPHNPTHEDWGWYDLRGARIHNIGGGYLLDLPRPEPLD